MRKLGIRLNLAFAILTLAAAGASAEEVRTGEKKMKNLEVTCAQGCIPCCNAIHATRVDTPKFSAVGGGTSITPKGASGAEATLTDDPAPSKK